MFLREISRDDLPYINQWRADRGLVDCLGTPFRYIDKEVDDAWFQGYLSARRDNVRLAICLHDQSDAPIGVAYLLGIDWVARSAEFAIQIGDAKNLGKGIGKSASKMVLDHAFSDLNLNRVCLTVLESNVRAINLYKSLGFVEEGLLREVVFKNGTYLNMVSMAILADEFFDTSDTSQC